MNLFLPGNLRYQPVELQPYFGYDNLYKAYAQVESATLQVLADINLLPLAAKNSLTPEKLLAVAQLIITSEIDRLEKEVTKHDVRALVLKIKEIVGPELAPWIHVPLTSYDVIDTARILQFKAAYEEGTKPALKKGLTALTGLIKKHAGTLQIGRTHGQHALPITVGFWLASIAERWMINWEQMENAQQNLVGKISGAVGAYNAQVGVNVDQVCRRQTNESFEAEVLKRLGLRPGVISTQILLPERLAYFLFATLSMSATIGQFGRDARQLMRTEIDEVTEDFSGSQVGSSTMAHKRNPINFENSEGMYFRNVGEFQKVLLSLISEHQRDLVASSLYRDFPIIMINLQQQLNTLNRVDKQGRSFLERININVEQCQRNFALSSGVILAEPLYIMLQMFGYEGDAHEFVNHTLTPIAKASGQSLVEVLEQLTRDNRELDRVFQSIPSDLVNLLRNPEMYVGYAEDKAEEVAELAAEFLAKH